MIPEKKKRAIRLALLEKISVSQITRDQHCNRKTVERVRESVLAEDIEQYQQVQFSKLVSTRGKYLEQLEDAVSNKAKAANLEHKDLVSTFSAIDKAYNQVISNKKAFTLDDMKFFADRVYQIITTSCPDCPKLENLSSRIKMAALQEKNNSDVIDVETDENE